MLSSTTEGRLVSLDVYRGILMISLVSNHWGLKHLYDSEQPIVGALARAARHANWVFGWNHGPQTFWDLIMPGFLLIVGLAMVFSMAQRRERGSGTGLGKAIRRSLLLVGLGCFLRSVARQQPSFDLYGILQVIGVCYFFAFLCYRLSLRAQVVVVVAILVGYWVVYEFISVGGVVPGTYAKHANIGTYVDLFLFGKASGELGMPARGGGLVTIHIVPTIAIVIFGIWTGHLLRSALSAKHKLSVLAVAAVAGISVGSLLGIWIPMNRGLMTVSFTVYSVGWALLLLLALYWLIDIRGYRKWTFPFVVVGMNPITIYMLSSLFGDWIGATLLIFDRPLVARLGWGGPILQSWLTVVMLWALCYWLYRNRIFLRV